MRQRRIRAIAKKEWLQIRRDTRSLLLSIGMPMLMIVLFGWALKLDVKNIKTAIYDMDKTSMSRDFITRFSSSDYFTIVTHVDTYDEITLLMDRGKIAAAIVIPRDFSKNIKARRGTELQVICDGTNSLTAQILMGYVSVITTMYSESYILETLQTLGIAEITLPIEVSLRVWYNSELESKNFIIPGLIAVIMMIIAGLVTSLTIAREWERGTMEQLITTPVTPSELIIGKLIPYVGLGLFDFILAVSVGTLVFGVPLKGNLFLLFSLSFIFMVGAMAFGVFISINTKKQLIASQVAMITTFLPAFLLSGFVFPITNMPKILQVLTYIIPARYFIVILRGIFLKGVGISVLWAEGFFLTIFTILVVIISIKRFKKELT